MRLGFPAKQCRRLVRKRGGKTLGRLGPSARWRFGGLARPIRRGPRRQHLRSWSMNVKRQGKGPLPAVLTGPGGRIARVEANEEMRSQQPIA